jgi:tetratricopeptide (TPR) repeat protein
MALGQVALYHDDLKAAVEHLKQAVALLPDSVAAWAMLSTASQGVGDSTAQEKALARATQLTAKTPEDLLFLGQAESRLDPARGLRTLAEAVRRRPSALARFIRADVLKYQLMDQFDRENARLALEDVRWMLRNHGDSAVVLALSLDVHLLCYHGYSELGLPELRQGTLDEGKKLAGTLERFPDSIAAVTSRWNFLREVSEEGWLLPAVARLAEKNNDAGSVYYCGGALYRAGRQAEAVRVLEKRRGEFFPDFLRACALADLPNGLTQANRLCDEMAARAEDGWDRFNHQLLLRFLGHYQVAVDASLKMLAQPEKFPPVRRDAFRAALRYCAGQLSEKDLLDAVRGSRGDLANAHCCIALTALAVGDRKKAKEHFRLSAQTHYFEFIPHFLSQILVHRMDKDPTWPLWVPAAK